MSSAPSTPGLAIETTGLTRRFGAFTAVDDVSLAVPRGTFYGFLGENGAGKSTTIKCLTGLLRPSAGRVSILGLDPGIEDVAVKRVVGVVPEDLALFDRLTAAETLQFVGAVHGLDGGEIQRRQRELLDVLDLESAAGGLVGDFSHGMKKKTALAVALLPAPRVLFLDEPFEGIDPVSTRHMKELLTGFVAGGGTVFLTSHILEVVDRLCDHIGVIAKGRLVAQEPRATLAAHAGGLEGAVLELLGHKGSKGASLAWLRS